MIWSFENRMIVAAIFTALMCSAYILIDGRRMLRAFREGTYDEKFGFVMSMVIMCTGLAGVVKHYWF